MPLLLLPLGFGFFWLLVASGENEDPPVWAAIAVGALVCRVPGAEPGDSANLFFVFRPGDVEKLEFVPAPKFSWRHFTGRKHMVIPRVRIHTRQGTHEVAMPDGKFKRHIEKGLSLLAATLQVQVVR